MIGRSPSPATIASPEQRSQQMIHLKNFKRGQSKKCELARRRISCLLAGSESRAYKDQPAPTPTSCLGPSLWLSRLFFEYSHIRQCRSQTSAEGNPSRCRLTKASFEVQVDSNPVRWPNRKKRPGQAKKWQQAERKKLPFSYLAPFKVTERKKLAERQSPATRLAQTRPPLKSVPISHPSRILQAGGCAFWSRFFIEIFKTHDRTQPIKQPLVPQDNDLNRRYPVESSRPKSRAQTSWQQRNNLNANRCFVGERCCGKSTNCIDPD